MPKSPEGMTPSPESMESKKEIVIGRDTPSWSGQDYDTEDGGHESYMVFYPKDQPIVWVFETQHPTQDGSYKKSTRIEIEQEGSDRLVDPKDVGVTVKFE